MNILDYIPDPRNVLGSKALDAGINTAQDAVNDLRGKEGTPDPAETLHAIRLLLIEVATFLQASPAVKGDLYKFIVIYKSGFGPPYVPSHIDNRQNFQIFNGTSYLLNVTAPGIGNFNLTTVASSWTNTSLPDGTSYYLDPSVTPNQVTFYQRDTNADIV